MKILNATIVALLAGWTPSFAAPQATYSNTGDSDRKPNILFLLVDDLKPLLGAYGKPVIQTPNMDRLAGKGVIFDAAYCNQAICAPTRNALMTGIRPQSMGIYDLGTFFREALPDAVTLPQKFGQAGYRTQGLGKTYHLGHGNRADPASWTEPYWFPKPAAKTYANADKSNPSPATERANVADDFYFDGLMSREVVRRIESWNPKTDQPFFIAAGFIRPHLPFVAPEKYWALYDGKKLPVPSRLIPPEGASKFAGNPGGEMRAYSDIPKDLKFSSEQAVTLTHGYYAATSYVDAQIGLILDVLDRNGLWENTIVVLWGDHGFHLGELGSWAKNTCYEEASRIPLVIVTPGGSKGARTSALVETVDIFPTLCDLASITPPEGIEGRSFASLLNDPSGEFREWVTHVVLRPAESNMIGQAIRNRTHRLVEWKTPGTQNPNAPLELYAIAPGGMEEKNIVNENPEVVAKLKQLLYSIQAKPQITGKLPSKGAE
jgi:iduronate 2-sulfatase